MSSEGHLPKRNGLCPVSVWCVCVYMWSVVLTVAFIIP